MSPHEKTTVYNVRRAMVRRHPKFTEGGHCVICMEACNVCDDPAKCVKMYCVPSNSPEGELPAEGEDTLESCTRAGLARALDERFPDDAESPDDAVNAAVVVLPCGEAIHAGCMKEYVRAAYFDNTCPSCKQRISPDDDVGIDKNGSHYGVVLQHIHGQGDGFSFPTNDVAERQAQAAREGFAEESSARLADVIARRAREHEEMLADPVRRAEHEARVRAMHAAANPGAQRICDEILRGVEDGSIATDQGRFWSPELVEMVCGVYDEMFTDDVNKARVIAMINAANRLHSEHPELDDDGIVEKAAYEIVGDQAGGGTLVPWGLALVTVAMAFVSSIYAA